MAAKKGTQTRPSKLTPERQRLIATAIAAGNSRDMAARYAGVAPQTMFIWLAKGRAATSGMYHDFAEAVEKADADATVTAVANIRQAMRDSWQAAAWWLERRWPDEWGRRERQTIEHQGGIDQRIALHWADGSEA